MVEALSERITFIVHDILGCRVDSSMELIGEQDGDGIMSEELYPCG